MFHFTKMHGLGNDYIFVDCSDNKNYISNPSVLSKKISNRNFGIGSDGLIIIENSKIADYKIRIFNSDGSEAEMCGNGIRCVGKFLFDKKLITKNKIKIETLAGIKELELKIGNNIVSSVSVCIGKAIISDEIQLNINNNTFNVTPVLVGNPHAVIFTNDLKNLDINKFGPLIEKNNAFVNNTNVEFAQVINPNLIKVKVWERGSGFTYACGTGASAVTAVAYSKKLVYQTTNIELPGGFLKTYISNSNDIYISGPVTTVYDGIYLN